MTGLCFEIYIKRTNTLRAERLLQMELVSATFDVLVSIARSEAYSPHDPKCQLACGE
jgi:hypothetical protein